MALPTKTRGYPSKVNRADGLDGPEPPDVRLYVIECGEFIKIGLAADLPKRFRQAEAANPYPLRLVGSVPVRSDKAGVAERIAHENLAEFHHRYEWFRATGRQGMSAIRAAYDKTRWAVGPWEVLREEREALRERALAEAAPIAS